MTPATRKTVVEALQEKRQTLELQRRYYSQGCGANHPAVADVVAQQKRIDDSIAEVELLAVTL